MSKCGFMQVRSFISKDFTGQNVGVINISTGEVGKATQLFENFVTIRFLACQGMAALRGDGIEIDSNLFQLLHTRMIKQRLFFS